MTFILPFHALDHRGKPVVLYVSHGYDCGWGCSIPFMAKEMAT